MRLLTALLLGLLVAGCATERPPAPTLAELRITSAPNLNPDEGGTAQPVIVKLFRLRAPAAFQRASFQQLDREDEKTLGRDLVGTVEFEFYPDQRETVTRKLDPTDNYLGFLVTYRDPEKAKWRDLIPIPQNRTTEVEVNIGPRAIIVRPATGQTAHGG